MRRLILTFTCFFISLGAAIGQDSRLENIVAMVQTNRVSASVECKVFVAESSTPVTIKADILAQGDCYYAESFGYRIYCNGTTRWTVDSENKEVYIEKAGGIIAGRMAILAEGDAQDREDLIYLEKLPLFNPDGSVMR